MKIEDFVKRFFSVLRLSQEQESNEIIHESIEQGVVFKGANLWILIFAILVASVGLNMNSTAVVIGAMLISPLIGPITGVGYSVATYNFPLLRKSLKNIGFAAGMSLAASTLYFLLSPIHTEHSELLTRTSPTIYDVLIGFFGGLAGIVAISSKFKGNVIPGVAIATALMPPLCTAGYGLAIGNWTYFFGALYLFFINSVYIALSAMIVSQLLRFPRKSRLLTREIKNKNIAIIVVIVVTVVPSFYLGYMFVQKEKFVLKAESFVKKVSWWEGDYLLKSEINSATKEIKLIFSGNEIDSVGQKRLRDKADDLGLEDAKITVEKTLSRSDFQTILKTGGEQDVIKGENLHLKSTLNKKDWVIDSLNSIPQLGASLLKEIKPIYPQIQSCSYSVSMQYVDSLQNAKPVVLVYFGTSESLSEEEETRLYNWLKNRLNTEEVIMKL